MEGSAGGVGPPGPQLPRGGTALAGERAYGSALGATGQRVRTRADGLGRPTARQSAARLAHASGGGADHRAGAAAAASPRRLGGTWARSHPTLAAADRPAGTQRAHDRPDSGEPRSERAGKMAAAASTQGLVSAGRGVRPGGVGPNRHRGGSAAPRRHRRGSAQCTLALGAAGGFLAAAPRADRRGAAWSPRALAAVGPTGLPAMRQ
jgi:hypothetical protein